jgi:hypothetical protein
MAYIIYGPNSSSTAVIPLSRSKVSIYISSEISGIAILKYLKKYLQDSLFSLLTTAYTKIRVFLFALIPIARSSY